MSSPSSAVATRLRSSAKNHSDKLIELTVQAAAARDLELQLIDLEASRKELQEKLTQLYQVTLPDLMDEIGIDRIGVPQSGNLPAVDYRMKPYYSASIAASWPQEKRDAAFSTLKRLHAEDLIKTEVSARLPKGSLKVAKALLAAAKKLKVTADLKLSVHSGTLSSWLRGVYEDGHALSASDLEAIGGSVGRLVKPEERK